MSWIVLIVSFKFDISESGIMLRPRDEVQPLAKGARMIKARGTQSRNRKDRPVDGAEAAGSEPASTARRSNGFNAVIRYANCI